MTTTPDTLAKLAADNVPERIYLVLGEDIAPDDDPRADFDDLAEVTWCIDKQFDNDVEYVRADVATLTAQALPAAEPVAQPEFIPVAKRKLHDLQDQGYLINGYSLIHKEKLTRGLIDSYGFVGWWNNRDHEQAATPKAALVAEFGEHMAGYSEGFDDGKGVAERQAAQATAGWVLVPVEPTDAMLDAGKRETHSNKGAREKTLRIYRAMLAAALPQPQPQSAQEDV